MRLKSWERDTLAHREPLSLPAYRETRERERQELLDSGTTTGFFLGVAAACLAWAIMSGFLVKLALGLVYVAVTILSSGPVGR